MVDVTNTEITTYNTAVAATRNAATADVADTSEAFTITPTKSFQKVLIYMENVSNSNGSVEYSVAAGGFWAAGAALTGEIAQGTGRAIILETAKYKKSDGTIVITITPAEGKKLLSDHAFRMTVFELP